MVLMYYIVICALSLVCCMTYYWRKRSFYSLRYTLVFMLAFLAHFCYVLLALARDVREAIVINKFLYIGGCFLPLVGLLLVFSICKIYPPRWAHFLMIGLSFIVYCAVLTTGYSPLFYESVDIAVENGVCILVKEYGPLHILFLIEIGSLLVATLGALIYGWVKRPDVSRKSLAIAAFMQIFSIFCYFIGRAITKDIEWMALADLVDEIGFLIIMDRVGLYLVDDLVSSSILKEGKVGYISLDFKKRYLSSNATAKSFLPQISKNRADNIVESDELRELFDNWIDEFKNDNVSKKHVYRRGELIYAIRVGDLYDGRMKRGYLIEITDDTAHQQHMEGIERYNKNLNEELRAKTELIRELRSQRDSQ